MRLLHIRFKNLNSLVGEWYIDFTHPAYVVDGIFAITGPTGAGKSTILDAICLALYGQTPRLKTISKSVNELFSRRTGECFAEVGFETNKGQYRCHWSQHRARRKASGELQSPKHEIVDAQTDIVLESKLREVIKRVEQVTGMDFDRFTRSMLLAQGGFAAFLNADPDARSPLLEQITGTEIYSHISQKTHQRCSEENKTLEQLKAELAGLRLLSADEEHALEVQKQRLQQRETVLSELQEKSRIALDWLIGIARLEQQMMELQQHWQAFELEQQQPAFQSQQQRLQQAKQALRLAPHYNELSNVRKLLQREQAALVRAREQYSAKAAAAEAGQLVQQKATLVLEGAQQALQREAGLIKQVETLDRDLTTLREQQQTCQQTLSKCELQGQRLRERITLLIQQQAKTQAELTETEQYLAAHSSDAALIEKLAGLQQRFDTWRTLEERRGQVQQMQTSAAKVAAEHAAQCVELESTLQQQRKQRLQAEQKYDDLGCQISTLLQGRELSELRAALDHYKEQNRLLGDAATVLNRIQTTTKLLAELHSRKQTLLTEHADLSMLIEQQRAEQLQREQSIDQQQEKLSLLQRIRDLEQERKHLQDGLPCPLCGALEHPYAAGNSPQLEQAEIELKEFKIALRQLNKQLDQHLIRQTEVSQELQQSQREEATQSEQITLAEQHYQQICETLASFPGLSLNSANLDTEQINTGQSVLQQHIQQSLERIAAVEERDKEQKKVLTDLSLQRRALDGSDQQLRELSQQRERAEQAQQRASEEASALAEQTQTLQQRLSQELAEHGLETLEFTALDTLQTTLCQRRDAWRSQSDAKHEHEKNLYALQIDLRAEQSQLSQLDQAIDSARQEQATVDQHLVEQTQERMNLYGDKDPTVEEQRLHKALEQARTDLDQCQQAYQQSVSQSEHWQQESKRLQGLVQQLEHSLSDLEMAFMGQLNRYGFSDEVEYCMASLSDEQRQALEQQDEAFRRRRTELETRRQDTHTALEQERTKALSEQTREQLQSAFESSATELKTLQRELGALQSQLDDNTRQRARQQQRLQVLQAQTQECQRWNRLELLIGSYDGKKYRNFAQGLTFEVMVAAANQQLQKMNDRYLLVRDNNQPLELNVIDQYQAGEVRSTKNLSGGESFIVSLALALGLAQMASRNVRVDSLFLDEGFGTLDQDALETALDALAGLRQEGKLIGVISHVAELKERIGTQIQVIRQPGGQSGLSGPGCHMN